MKFLQHSSTAKSPFESLFDRPENGLHDVKFTTQLSKSWLNDYFKKMEQNRVRNLKIISKNAKQNQKVQYDKNVCVSQKYDVGRNQF